MTSTHHHELLNAALDSPAHPPGPLAPMYAWRFLTGRYPGRRAFLAAAGLWLMVTLGGPFVITGLTFKLIFAVICSGAGIGLWFWLDRLQQKASELDQDDFARRVDAFEVMNQLHIEFLDARVYGNVDAGRLGAALCPPSGRPAFTADGPDASYIPQVYWDAFKSLQSRS